MNNATKRTLATCITTAMVTIPEIAMAAQAGGGGMPYSTGLNTLSTSVRTEIAGILILIAVVIGVGMWIAGGQLDGMLLTVARVIIGACIVGSVATFLSTIGVAGALI